MNKHRADPCGITVSPTRINPDRPADIMRSVQDVNKSLAIMAAIPKPRGLPERNAVLWAVRWLTSENGFPQGHDGPLCEAVSYNPLCGGCGRNNGTVQTTARTIAAIRKLTPRRS